MFKTGDTVRLNSLGRESLSQATGEVEVTRDPCTTLLLSGESLVVSNVVPQAGGKSYSLHFFGSAYSYTEKYFELT